MIYEVKEDSFVHVRSDELKRVGKLFESDDISRNYISMYYHLDSFKLSRLIYAIHYKASGRRLWLDSRFDEREDIIYYHDTDGHLWKKEWGVPLMGYNGLKYVNHFTEIKPMVYDI